MLWIAAAKEAGWSTSSNPEDAVPGAIAIWTLETGQESIYYVALVHCVGKNQYTVFSYFSKTGQTVRYFSRRGLDILKNERGLFRGFILPQKGNNGPSEPDSSCKIPVNPADTAERTFQEGHALIKQKQYAEAEAVAEQMIRQNANEWRAYDLRGLSFFRRGRYAEAAQDYLQTLQLLPQHVYAHYYLGHCYESLKEYDKARAEYKRFIAMAQFSDANVVVVEKRLAALP